MASLVIQVLIDSGGEATDHGMSIPPQLYVAVRCHRQTEPANFDEYYSRLRTAFNTTTNSVSDEGLVVDCANDVV